MNKCWCGKRLVLKSADPEAVEKHRCTKHWYECPEHGLDCKEDLRSALGLTADGYIPKVKTNG
jgi:hypothetical protein